MKITFSILFFFLLSNLTHSQTTTGDSTGPHKDSIAKTLAVRLQINQQQAVAVLAAIDSSFIKVRGIAGNTSLSSEQKTNSIKEIATARDTKIAALLTQEQVDKLKVFMAENKLRKTGD